MTFGRRGRSYSRRPSSADALAFAEVLRTAWPNDPPGRPEPMSSALKRDEAAAVTAVLQNGSESIAARTAACDAVLELSKSEGSCAVLCSVGGIHAVVSALRGPERSPAMLKAALTTLSNLYRFDPKLVSIIARLQRGIVSILEAMREHLHTEDSSLLHALLGALSDVSNAPANAVLIAQENGTAVLLACVLAHLKDELTLLPALHVLGAISRTPSHVSLLVREGGVPALLAAILAHLKRIEVLKAALGVLRNIVSDTQAAQRLSGQGAYRIIFAVLQATRHNNTHPTRSAHTLKQHAPQQQQRNAWRWVHVYLSCVA